MSRLRRGSNETYFLAGGEEGDVHDEITNRHQTFCFELNDFYHHSQMWIPSEFFEIKFIWHQCDSKLGEAIHTVE